MAPPRKFEQLTARLAALSSDQRELRLTLAELEQVLGTKLPPSAWVHTYWETSTVARNNWLRCGFHRLP